jgi:hypothetical protein
MHFSAPLNCLQKPAGIIESISKKNSINDPVMNRSDRKQCLIAGDVITLDPAIAWMTAGLQRGLFPQLEGCWRVVPCRPS